MNSSKTNEWLPEDRLSAKDVEEQYPPLTRTAVWAWAREGVVPVIRLPKGRILFVRRDIEALLVPVAASSTPARADELEAGQ